MAERMRRYCPECGEYTTFELKEDRVYYFDGHWYREKVWYCLNCLLKGFTPHEVRGSYEVESPQDVTDRTVGIGEHVPDVRQALKTLREASVTKHS